MFQANAHSSTSRFVSSFLSGSVPLFFKYERKNLVWLSLYGSGILVGTALTVMIPEGIATLYELEINSIHSSLLSTGKHLVADEGLQGQFEAHTYIGTSLLTGFLFMMILEYTFASHDDTSDAIVTHNNISNKHLVRHPVVLGFIFHSASDGFALGAASLSASEELEILVFLAIILHKGPSALGFVSFLLKQGCSLVQTRNFLGLFSAAAPMSALATSFFLNVFQQNDENELEKWTGIILLFSAGTFLYVSMLHILPDSLKFLESSSKPRATSKWRKVACLVGGILTPTLLSMVCEHHH
jgi:zinc transporter 9